MSKSTLRIDSFVDQIYQILRKEFGKPRTPLRYTAPHELAIAVILSAQCTDEQVNRVSPALFSRFKRPEDFYQAPSYELEKLIYSTGFYKNKAKSIRGFCKMLVEKYQYKIPDNIKDLTAMPGVGRKTANVIMQELHHKAAGIVVDTHVARISKLLKLTRQKDPYKIEQDLIKKVEQRYWLDWSLLLIFLGRKYCTARVRRCQPCPLRNICPASQTKNEPT